MAYYNSIVMIAYAFMLQAESLLADEEFALIKEGYKEIALLALHGEIKAKMNKKNPYEDLDMYMEQKIKGFRTKIKKDYLNDRNLYILNVHLLLRDHLLHIINLVLKICEDLQDSIRLILLEDLFFLKNLYSLVNKFPQIQQSPKSFNQNLIAKLLAFHHKSSLNEMTTNRLEKIFLFILIQLLTNLHQIVTHSSLFKKNTISCIQSYINQLNNDLLESNQIDNRSDSSFQESIHSTLVGIELTNKALKKVQKELSDSNKFQHVNTHKKTDSNIQKHLLAYHKWNAQKLRLGETHYNRLLS